MQPKPKCPLCRTNGLLKTEVLAETPQAYLTPAFSSPGNFLIVPTRHAESPLELPNDWWESVKLLLPNIPGRRKNYNISVNLGADAGQTVAHIHFWIIPRSGGKPSSGKGFARLISETDAKV